ncbi:hypothetical protein TNIN_468061 [Trichonephila inaurata madagascariensis]|uniref:Uncharacterized protein n=1 Tax=Trichonephila inaurata madagascariensis TaxID=2747483 RepID=A0A8X7CND1_9ARAC|nr:hypothetical protein TNIN_468061 [Trichonephila inaurata madagascariensis]
MVELHDPKELHIEQEVQQISLEVLNITPKCPVVSDVEQLAQLKSFEYQDEVFCGCSKISLRKAAGM